MAATRRRRSLRRRLARSACSKSGERPVLRLENAHAGWNNRYWVHSSDGRKLETLLPVPDRVGVRRNAKLFVCLSGVYSPTRGVACEVLCDGELRRTIQSPLEPQQGGQQEGDVHAAAVEKSILHEPPLAPRGPLPRTGTNSSKKAGTAASFSAPSSDHCRARFGSPFTITSSV